ncbi:MAG: hypothetical protein ACKVP7_12465 [Hyphomicrobiaceae bacterium]
MLTAETRTVLENIATRPSPAVANGAIFPREVLERSLVRLKWGKSKTAAADILKAVGLAKQRAEVAETRAKEQLADSGEGGQCLRLKADSITVIADT